MIVIKLEIFFQFPFVCGQFFIRGQRNSRRKASILFVKLCQALLEQPLEKQQHKYVCEDKLTTGFHIKTLWPLSFTHFLFQSTMQSRHAFVSYCRLLLTSEKDSQVYHGLVHCSSTLKNASVPSGSTTLSCMCQIGKLEVSKVYEDALASIRSLLAEDRVLNAFHTSDLVYCEWVLIS